MTFFEIAKSCGIAKGTFYNFFDSKEQFVLEIILRNRDRLKAYFKKLPDENGYIDRKNKRPDCDLRVVANYIKISAIASLNKDKVIEEALPANISGILELILNEIYGHD